MMCDQATCVIYTSLSNKDIQNRFRITDLRNALLNASPATTRADAFKDVPDDVISCYATLNHELDHLRRQFSNSCGFLALHLRSRLIEVSQHLILEEKFRGNDIAFPLLKKFYGAGWLLEATSDPLRLVERWIQRNDQERSVLTALATVAGIRGIEQGARAAERVLTDAAMLRAAGDGLFAPIGFAHPKITPEIDETIGAYDFYEHMALMQELCWRSRLGGEIDEWGSLIESDVRYRKIMLLWHHYFPESIHLDQGSMRPADLFTDAYRMYPVEFYALLDLALWPPFSPKGFRTTRRPLRWEDIQPGHRFVRGVVLLKESGRELTPVSSDHRERRFDEVQHWVAEKLGWEPAHSLAAEWYAYLEKDDWFEERLFVGFRPHPPLMIARKVLEERSKCAFNAVCNNVAWQQNQELRFAVWITNEGQDGYHMGGVAAEPTYNVTKDFYYLFHGSELLLFGKRAARHLLGLDSVSRRKAMDVINNAFVCEGWDSDYFLRMSEPMFE